MMVVPGRGAASHMVPAHTWMQPQNTPELCGWAGEEIQAAALESELHPGQGLHKDVAGYGNLRADLKDTLLSPQQLGGRR